MSAYSNIDEITTALSNLADCLDMTKGYGKDALAKIATNISDRARAESGPDGGWDENRGSYGRRKRDKGLPVGVGLKGSNPRMLSLQEIAGEQEVTATEATMTFGTSEASQRKGQWFSAGSVGTADAEPSGAKNQPARPFFRMTAEDEDELIDMAAEAVGRFLEEL